MERYISDISTIADEAAESKLELGDMYAIAMEISDLVAITGRKQPTVIT